MFRSLYARMFGAVVISELPMYVMSGAAWLLARASGVPTEVALFNGTMIVAATRSTWMDAVWDAVTFYCCYSGLCGSPLATVPFVKAAVATATIYLVPHVIMRSLTSSVEGADKCPICLDGVADCRTRCGHEFHRSCLFKAIERDRRCPMCRTDLLTRS